MTGTLILLRHGESAWNAKNIDHIATFFWEDFENDQVPLPLVQGVAAYRSHLQAWFTAFPNLRLEVVTVFSQQDLVCLETRATGTPVADFFGIHPAGGRHNRALDILVFDRGLIRKQRGYWDFSLWTGQPSPLTTS